MSGRRVHKTHFTQPEMPWKKDKEETVELKWERPIIFNAEMVKAILEGRKTQTRRVIKPQPKHSASYWICGKNGVWADGHGWQKLCPYGQPGDELWVRPIIFNAEMVKAILEGRKTQTRRVIKPQPKHSASYWICGKNGVWADGHGWQKLCPYGQPGDELWVRETWAAPGNDYEDCKPSELLKNWFKPERLKYRATEQYGDVYYKWRPSIHMPRWASRIQLEVVNVRVERVKDIRPEEFKLEGASSKGYLKPNAATTSKGFATLMDFILLWDSINEKRGFGWDANPWVWVVEFKVIEVKNGHNNSMDG